jgi:hypothetical protein
LAAKKTVILLAQFQSLDEGQVEEWHGISYGSERVAFYPKACTPGCTFMQTK